MEPFMELSGSGRQVRLANDDRESRIQSALRAYESSHGVEPPKTVIMRQACASGRRSSCLNYSTAKASRTRNYGISACRRKGSGFASSDEHYVVVIGEEAIDATARQFDQTGEPITRRSLKEVAAPWHAAQPVRIGYVEPLIGKDLHDIPANRRQLADVDPPGDAIGWPYAGPWPTNRRGPAGAR
jgi:hypothetical protein